MPVSPELRQQAIELANRTFENIIDRIEPDNPKTTRLLWNAEYYIDNKWLNGDDALPISEDYSLSLIEAFLVHYGIDLAIKADKQHNL